MTRNGATADIRYRMPSPETALINVFTQGYVSVEMEALPVIHKSVGISEWWARIILITELNHVMPNLPSALYPLLVNLSATTNVLIY